MHRSLNVFLLIGITCVLAHRADGDILSTSGAMFEIAPPTSVVIGALESSSTIFVFDEGISPVPLTPDLFFDHVGPGPFEGTPPPYFPMPVGALLHSYLVHFDPDGGALTSLTGTVTFDPGEIIVGLQAHTPDIFSTDFFFGDGSVTYPTVGSDDDRGFDTFITVDDTGTVALDLNSVTFELKAELGVDEVRVFTVAPVPEPSTFVLAGLGLLSLGLVGWRSRRRA